MQSLEDKAWAKYRAMKHKPTFIDKINATLGRWYQVIGLIAVCSVLFVLAGWVIYGAH